MKVAIIGSGPAGAAAAHTLSKKGMEVVVFERDAAIGGRTQSLRKDGFVLDTGAGFVTNFYPRLLELAKERGFQNEIEEMNRISGLFRDQRLASLNVGSIMSFLQYPFLTWMEKAKMAFWMLGVTLKRRRYDIADPSTLIEIDQRSIADHARAVLSDNIYHSLVRPGIEPFWYFSCEDVSEGLFVGLSAHAAGAKFYTLKKGIDRICSALLQEAKVQCKTPVENISEEQGSFRVHFSRDGDNQSAVFDRVVFATTASVAARLSRDLSEEHVSSAQRSFLEEQCYAANIHACFAIPTLEEEPEAGSIFPCDEKKRKLAAVSFHRAKNHKRGSQELVSVYLSDVHAREWMNKTDSEIYDECWFLAREVYPALPKSFSPFSIRRRPEAIPVHAVGRYADADRFQQMQQGRKVYFCGDYLATATIEGAIATGLAVQGIDSE